MLMEDCTAFWFSFWKEEFFSRLLPGSFCIVASRSFFLFLFWGTFLLSLGCGNGSDRHLYYLAFCFCDSSNLVRLCVYVDMGGIVHSNGVIACIQRAWSAWFE